ncbi:MAG: stalk domain-containing protein [Defluviitaleaceae bacterium]|nr:stalk domain-containing protein [Defluviitaleaceae bacterium]
MKLFKKLLATTSLIFFSIFVPLSLSAVEINVEIGLAQVEFADAQPAIIDGRTFVPIREVFEHLGYRTEWNPATQTIVLTNNHNNVIITIGSNIFAANEKEFLLDAPAQLVGRDAVMMPVRSILENLGYYVGWNAATSTVQIAPVPASGIDGRLADNFHDFIVDYAFLDWGIIVLEADADTLWATQFRTGSLLKSTDHGDTWTAIYQFARPINAIYADDFGNLFVTTTLDRWAAEGSGEVFRSTDGGKNFDHVLNIGAGVPLRWNIASQDGTMFMSEYGFKWLDNNARRIYRSLDFGETWVTVYEPPQLIDFHMHKILMTDDGIIYQSIGDGQNAQIIRSLDNGYTWEVVTRGFQPTSGLVFDTHILWGLDGGPWMGVARHDRTTGVFSRALTLPYPFFGPAYDMIMHNGIIYAMFLSYEGYDFPASFFFSKDEGETWELMGYITKPIYRGIGLNHIVTDGVYLYVDIGVPLERGRGMEFFRGTLRISLLDMLN